MSGRTRKPNLKDYLTVGEAAEFMGVCAATLRNWDVAGKLAAFRHPMNGYRLYKRGQLERFLNRLSNGGNGRRR